VDRRRPEASPQAVQARPALSLHRWLVAEADGTFDEKKAFALCRSLSRVRIFPSPDAFSWADRYDGVPLLPGLVAAPLRRHVAVLGAFGRLLREIPRTEEGLRVLESWRQQLDAVDVSVPAHPVLLALGCSIQELEIPHEPYENLIDAAVSDCAKTRCATESDLMEHCRLSANSVGRIILMIHGYKDPELLKMSDDIFTAFRMTTYLRNVKRDLDRDRVFLPQEDFREFGYTEADLRMGVVNERFRNLMKDRWKKTRALYESGKPLIRKIQWPLSWQIKLKWLRGNLLLRKIRRYGFDTLHSQPSLKKWDWPRLIGGVLLP